MEKFCFVDCVEINQGLGLKAQNESQLMELIEEVPIDSIYFHMHSYFLRHYYILGPFPNDFASWAAVQVRDKVLGEKLSSIVPSRTSSQENIRTELITMIDEHINDLSSVPAVVFGKPFYFMKSQIIPVKTQQSAENLHELIEAMKVVDASALYYHVHEARWRTDKGRSDFSLWIDSALGINELAEELEGIDAYMYSLESLRTKIIDTCSKYL